MWLPGTLLATLVLISYEFFLKRLEKGLTEEEIIQSSSNPKLIRKIRVSPRIFYRIFAPAGAAVFLLLGDPYRAFLLVSLIIMWSIFSDWVTNVPLIRLRSSEIVMILFHWVPIVFFFVFFLGYNKAADLASSTTSHIRLNLSDGKPSVEVNILRYIDKGVLVVQPTTKVVSLLQWSQVDSIEVLEPYKPYPGLLARWLRKKAAPSKAMQPVP